jgi:hypothetical protein
MIRHEGPRFSFSAGQIASKPTTCDQGLVYVVGYPDLAPSAVWSCRSLLLTHCALGASGRRWQVRDIAAVLLRAVQAVQNRHLRSRYFREQREQA